MSSKKGSMLYFAELDYKHILYIKDVEGLEDSTLVIYLQDLVQSEREEGV